MKRYVAMCIVGLALAVAGCAIGAGKLERGCKHCRAQPPAETRQPVASEAPE